MYNTRNSMFRDESYMPVRGETLNPAQYQLEREKWASSLDDVTVRSLAYDYLQGVDMEDTYDAYQEFKRRWPNSKYGQRRDRRRKPEPNRAPRAELPAHTAIKLCDAHMDNPETYTPECKRCVRISGGLTVMHSLRQVGSAIADQALDSSHDDSEAITDAPDKLPDAVIDDARDAI